MLNRIGLFHFGIKHNNPIGELRSAMYAASDITDSLIVLPEGFNLRVRGSSLSGSLRFRNPHGQP